MASCLYCKGIEYRILVETKIPTGNFNHGTRFIHHDNCDNLRQSADEGCRMCRVILEAIARDSVDKGLVNPDGTPIYPEGETLEVGGPSAGETRTVWINQPDGSHVIRIPRGRPVRTRGSK